MVVRSVSLCRKSAPPRAPRQYSLQNRSDKLGSALADRAPGRKSHRGRSPPMRIQVLLAASVTMVVLGGGPISAQIPTGEPPRAPAVTAPLGPSGAPAAITRDAD